MSQSILQYAFYLAIVVILAIPLGFYIGKVMNGEKVFLSRILVPCERFIYKLLRINKDENMRWKKYGLSILVFSAIGFIVLFLFNLFQGALPLNPEGFKGLSLDLAFNNTVSFLTNTNWQPYGAESTLSYFTEIFGLTVQNFLSAAIGIAVLFVLIRGFVKIKGGGLGNFWTDITRIILYVLLPLALVLAIALVSQGVVQGVGGYETGLLVEPITLENGTVITEQVIPQGAAASQGAIAQLGTNGGSLLNTNGAHPLMNPTPFTNLLEMLSILLIPMALCFTFGRNIKDKKQGIAIFIAMFLILVFALFVMAINEQNGTPALAQNSGVNMTVDNQSGGNMEGKESRFGIAPSVTWSTFTTAASNGSVNAMADSYTPFGGMVMMLLMALGEVVFGGVGSGLYGMLAFAILTVFIAGLMVGRTPEYLGKKIEPFEMKMAIVICLTTPVLLLIGSGIASVVPAVYENIGNGGPHGFSEILYAFSSGAGNNGSAFAGLNANTPFMNSIMGVVMLCGRFIPMMAVLAMAGHLSGKKKMASSVGTLPTHNGLFIGLLIFVVLLIGALSFLPALSLGPIAEYFQMMV